MTQRSSLALSLFAACALGTLAAGCAREHLSSNYAQAYSAWFTAQHVNHQPSNPEQTARIIDSLDAQEAATVSRSYRHIRGADEGEGGGRLLMVNPNRVGGGEGAYIPPPSVPGGQ